MKKKNSVGRPLRELDKNEFEKLCLIQCTQLEVCDWFGCDENTVNTWCKRTYGVNFSEVSRQKRGTGKVSLRRAQWRSAIEDKNTALLIFLGKQYLGQADKVEQQISDVSLEPRSEKELKEMAKEKLKLLGAINAKDEPQTTS